jgi:hypothetical protein
MSWTRKRAAWHPTTGRRPASLACHAHSSSRRSLSSAARATGEPGGILSCPGIPPLLRSAYRAAGGADPSGVSMFRTRETGWFRGRVAGTRYRAPAPSEPDKPVFRASRLNQARTEPAKPTGAGMPTQMPHRDYNELQLPYQSNLHWQGHSHPATSCRTALCTPGQAVPGSPDTHRAVGRRASCHAAGRSVSRCRDAQIVMAVRAARLAGRPVWADPGLWAPALPETLSGAVVALRSRGALWARSGPA